MTTANEAVNLTESGSNPRHASHARLILASAFARIGEPEESCRIASDVLNRTPQDVHTIKSRSGDLLASLAPFRSLPAVQEFGTVVRHYLSISGADLEVDL